MRAWVRACVHVCALVFSAYIGRPSSHHKHSRGGGGTPLRPRSRFPRLPRERPADARGGDIIRDFAAPVPKPTTDSVFDDVYERVSRGAVARGPRGRCPHPRVPASPALTPKTSPMGMSAYNKAAKPPPASHRGANVQCVHVGEGGPFCPSTAWMRPSSHPVGPVDDLTSTELSAVGL